MLVTVSSEIEKPCFRWMFFIVFAQHHRIGGVVTKLIRLNNLPLSVKGKGLVKSWVECICCLHLISWLFSDTILIIIVIWTFIPNLRQKLFFSGRLQVVWLKGGSDTVGKDWWTQAGIIEPFLCLAIRSLLLLSSSNLRTYIKRCSKKNSVKPINIYTIMVSLFAVCACKRYIGFSPVKWLFNTCHVIRYLRTTSSDAGEIR